MPKNLTDVSAFTAPVVVPVDADLANALSVETPFQALANRGRYLLNVLEATQALPGLPRTVDIPGSGFVPGSTSGAADWEILDGGELLSRVNLPKAFCDIRGLLPHGATLISVLAMWTPGAARTGTSRMRFSFMERTLDWDTPGNGTESPVVDFRDFGSITTLHVSASGVITTAINSQKQQFFRVVGGSDAGSNNDIFNGVRLVFTDPGPRSF